MTDPLASAAAAGVGADETAPWQLPLDGIDALRALLVDDELVREVIGEGSDGRGDERRARRWGRWWRASRAD